MQKKYFTCPHCGSDVPKNARACPECGSDEETGWSQAASYSYQVVDTGPEESSYFQSRSKLKRVMAAIALFLVSVYVTASFGGFYSLVFLALIIGIIYYATTIYPNTKKAREKRMYRQLLQKAMGSQELAERLIEYERQRDRQADRLKLIQSSLRRWQSDNR
ncbi:MAG: zinc-ribbon domain-containing protein [Prochloraceae cyanobacterium]